MKTYLLQADSSSLLIASAVVSFIVLLIIIIIAKAIFQISTIIKYQRVQCRLLRHIAKANGATQEEIDAMYKM